jgi:hypothetical protein
MNKATKRQIITRSENEKLDLIDHREQSGLSIKRFCSLSVDDLGTLIA